MIIDIIEKAETNKVEFKSSFQKEVIESIVSFTNVKGGKMLIGIDDRIKFFNPGKLYNDVTIEKLNTNNYSSCTRNRATARLFKEAGIIEQYGLGINRIKKECEAHGIIKPKFEEFVHGFRVIVCKEKLGDGVNEGVNKLLLLIRNNPNKKTPFFSKELSTSVKNTERWIKKLKDESKIEYKGSPKTGGYYEK